MTTNKLVPGKGMLKRERLSPAPPLVGPTWSEQGSATACHMSRFDCHESPLSMWPKPLLLVDVDGVISLYGFPPDQRPNGRFALVDGIRTSFRPPPGRTCSISRRLSSSSGARAGRSAPTTTSRATSDSRGRSPTSPSTTSRRVDGRTGSCPPSTPGPGPSGRWRGSTTPTTASRGAGRERAGRAHAAGRHRARRRHHRGARRAAQGVGGRVARTLNVPTRTEVTAKAV